MSEISKESWAKGFWPDPVIEWAATSMVDGNAPEVWIQGLAETILAGGIPVARMRIMFRILHPQLTALGFRWERGDTEIEVHRVLHGLEGRDIYRNSPVRVLDSGEESEIRRDLTRPVEDLDFPVLHELKEEGMTDYLALTIFTSVSRNGVVTFATDQDGGFTEHEVERLRQVVRAASRAVEILVRHETALSLLRAYLGHETGGRVLRGAVERGDGQSQDAVIWFSDLRGSTRLSEELPAPDYLSLLNNYFDCLAEPVMAREGEVLRFIGDAVLAIFPVPANDDAGWQRACENALAAAREAEQRVDELNRARTEEGRDPIGYGIGLHLGRVHYGNIGTAERVEFTVVGRAANEAAKIEAMCKPLKQRLVVSEELTKYHQGPWVQLGRHAIPGTKADMELFTMEAAS